MQDIMDNPKYIQWLYDLAKDCKCCPDCSEQPCEGLMAGGLCDEMCMCDDDFYGDDSPYNEYESDE